MLGIVGMTGVMSVATRVPNILTATGWFGPSTLLISLAAVLAAVWIVPPERSPRADRIVQGLQWVGSSILAVIGMTGLIVMTLSLGALIGSGWYGLLILLMSLAAVAVALGVAPHSRYYALIVGAVGGPILFFIFFIMLD